MILKDKGILILIICFGLVSALDVATTLFAINNGAQEMNPIANTVVSDPIKLCVMKLVGITIITAMALWVARWCNKEYPHLAHFSLALVIGVTLGAVINNVGVIYNMGLLVW